MNQIQIGNRHLALLPAGKLAALVTRIDENTKPVVLPNEKVGLIVFHRASRSYYSTITTDPFAYIKRLNPTHKEHRCLALALRRALGNHPDVDVFYMHVDARTEAELILKSMNFRRVATGRGEMQNIEHNLYCVVNPHNNVTRFVCAAPDEKHSKIIAAAQKSIDKFLRSSISKHTTLRERLKPIVGWSLFKQPEVFGIGSRVQNLGPMNMKSKDYSAFIRQKNIEALFNRVNLLNSYSKSHAEY